MFKKSQRLNSAQVKGFFGSSKTKNFKTESFLIKEKAKEKNEGLSKFAILIPKKIYKSSVARHFFKRKIILVIEEILNHKNIKNKDFVLILSRPFPKEIIRNKKLFNIKLKKEFANFLI